MMSLLKILLLIMRVLALAGKQMADLQRLADEDHLAG